MLLTTAENQHSPSGGGRGGERRVSGGGTNKQKNGAGEIKLMATEASTANELAVWKQKPDIPSRKPHPVEGIYKGGVERAGKHKLASRCRHLKSNSVSLGEKKYKKADNFTTFLKACSAVKKDERLPTADDVSRYGSIV